MFGFNNSISSLFGSFGSSASNSFANFNFSDYASLKNGSYRKLLKSYYAQQKEGTSSKKSSINYADVLKKTSLATPKLPASYTQLKKETDALKTAADDLKKDALWDEMSGDFDRDKITDAVKKFAQEYNDVLDQVGKAGSANATVSANYMSRMTQTFAKNLEKAGITVGKDGKLTVNEDTLKTTDLGNLKTLFTGKNSYAAEISEKAGEITRAALNDSSFYSKNGSFTNAYSSTYNTSV